MQENAVQKNSEYGHFSGFPKWGQLVGGHFWQNGQKLLENDKIGIFGSKLGGTWGDKPVFRVVGDPPRRPPPPPPPPTRGNPAFYAV